ncbi:MAG: hypothetical protein PVG32_21040, partial [Anaerolineales bacterium]
VEKLKTDDDPEVETFLRESARELGITNTLMFYERAFILIEGDSEENALPILYRKIYEHSLLEDGIRLINVKGNGAFKEFLRLFNLNRKELTIVFIDSDARNTDVAKLTEKTLRLAGFDDGFIDKRLQYIGDQEFEDAFSNKNIARCLQKKWTKSEGEWGPKDIEPLRSKDIKFSVALWEDLVSQQTKEELRSDWKKPDFAIELARCCNRDEIPEAIRSLFKLAREVAGSE